MSRSNKYGLPAAIACTFLALGACAPAKRIERFSVLFSAVTDAGEPLPGVLITANGKELGETGPEGGLVVNLQAPSGKVLRVSAACPIGYRSPIDETVLRLRRLAHVAENDRLSVTLECRPAIRHAAVLVRAPGLRNLPVTLHGREVARTDAHGLAHVLLAFAPGTRFQVGIDTSARPYLVPRSPTATFTLEDLDQVFVFAQDFNERRPKKKRRRRKPKPPGIVEIESIDKKPWQR